MGWVPFLSVSFIHTNPIDGSRWEATAVGTLFGVEYTVSRCHKNLGFVIVVDRCFVRFVVG